MKIDYRQVPQEGASLQHSYSPAELDLSGEAIKFIQPIKANFSVSKGINLLNVSVRLSSQTELTCGRCLETTVREFKHEFNFNYPLEKNQFIVEVDDDIKQELIFSFPLKILCKENCLGLCPVCGKNLNEGKCNCKNPR